MLNIGYYNFSNYQNNISFEGRYDKLLNKVQNYKGKISSFNLSFKDAVNLLKHTGHTVASSGSTHFNVKKEERLLFSIVPSNGSQLHPKYKTMIIKLLRDGEIKSR